jgi:hypothetical protein
VLATCLRTRLLPVTAVAVLAAGCSGAAAPAATVTATETETTTTTSTTRPPASATPTTASASAARAGARAAISVPNGVGLDYQSAQDRWRAVGLHVAPATDALGAHRIPIIDSNWVVVAQDPAAGVKVPVDTFITATVKKYTDR